MKNKKNKLEPKRITKTRTKQLKTQAITKDLIK